MIEQERATHTPFSVLFSARATGKIPRGRMLQLDPSGTEYYFQRDTGKTCLTRYTPRPDPNTDPQNIQREKLKSANQAWAALTPEQKESYRHHPLAHDKNLPPRQTFLSLHMRGKI